jgi:hypothetical protein
MYISKNKFSVIFLTTFISAWHNYQVKYNDKRRNTVCVCFVSTEVKRVMGTELPSILDFDHFYRKQGTLCIENMEILHQEAVNRQI